MQLIRAILWCGVLGWGLVLLNFLAGWANRRSLVRFTWTLAALAGLYLQLYRLGLQPPFLLRVGLDVAFALGGLLCGLARVFTLVRKGPEVLR